MSPRAPLTILLTGFGPFPGAPVNPTTALVRALVRRRRVGTADVRYVTHVFSTRYAAVDAELPALVSQHRPDAILMFGLAARRAHLSIETLARNRISLIFPDAGGGVARRTLIEREAPAERRGRAPMQRLVSAAKGTRVQTRLSRDAGRYVCNYVYWRALSAAAQPDEPRLAVFVHVPKLRRSRPRRLSSRPGRKRPAYALADLVRAGDAVLRAVIAAARRPNR